MFGLTHPIDFKKPNIEKLVREAEAFVKAHKKEIHPKNQEEYIQDLVRLSCKDRKEYSFVTQELSKIFSKQHKQEIKVDHRKDGPEVFFIRMIQNLYDKGGDANDVLKVHLPDLTGNVLADPDLKALATQIVVFHDWCWRSSTPKTVSNTGAL